MTKPIGVLLTDDHMVVRAGLSQIVQKFDNMTVLGEAENGEEALFLCQKLRPDVVIMDIRMDGMGGVAAVQALSDHHPSVRVIALSSFADHQTVQKVMNAGARGFLLKSIGGQALENAIRQVMDGAIILSPDLDAEPAGTMSLSTGNADDTPELTGQQRRVLALLSKGFTNPEIATHLGISPTTARYHVSAILSKLGVSNRAEAAAFAIRNDLVRDEDF